MNRLLYRTLFLSTVGLGLASSSLSAQTAAKDTTYNRQVSLEREYTPTIRDASKINTLPALHQPQRKQYDIKFDNSIPASPITSYPIGDTGSGNIQTEIDFSKQRGYLQFGAGMYSNMEGALGYRIVDSSKDKFDLFVNHNSTNGDIDFLDANPLLKKARAKNMENLVKAKYNHLFETLSWDLSASFYNNSFNYYGNPYIFGTNSEELPTSLTNMDKNQNFNVVDIETGIASNKTNEGIFYAANLKYNNFSNKHGATLENDGLSGNIVDANLNIGTSVYHNQKVGVEAGIFFQNFGDVDFKSQLEDDSFHNLTIFKALPYYKIEDGDLELKLGANVNWASDVENKFVVAPAVDLKWHFENSSLLYISATGGINDNNCVAMNRENRYITPSSRVFISQTLYDILLGVRSGVINGLEFDIFGGYKYTKDEHLFVPYQSSTWGNVSDMMYANIGAGHFGGSVKTQLIPYTDLSFKAIANFHNVSKYTLTETAVNKKEAWGEPTFTLDINADFSFIKNLTLSVNYILQSGREMYVYSGPYTYSMNNVNELNIKGSYNILNWLALYGKVNNVFNQKYEKYYGYTNQGLNALGGISLTF